MSKFFEKNFQRLYEIDTTPEGATPTWVRVAVGIKSADPSLNEDTDKTKYLDGNGFGSTDVIGKQFTIAFAGNRVKGDAAQDYILGKILEVGDSLKTNFRRTDAFGEIITGACTITGVDDGGGDAGAKVDIAFNIEFNGLPARIPVASAAALAATVAAGTVIGTTAFTATKGEGNHLGYKLKSASQGVVGGASFAEGYIAYTSAADIVATAGQYLCMYEIDANERVVKYLEELLTSGDIKLV